MFKLPQAKQFNYQPRFYDPDKEAREERMNKIKAELSEEEQEKLNEILQAESKDHLSYKHNIKGKMRSQYSKDVKSQRYSGLRLIVILIFLFGIAFYLLYS
ncbi:MAG: hypothetical protein C0594_17820 [Marinilabiliales bacterium]|nr:MAG: hypothetical protein C0594_17820 [Marinilabiliales bacterium]